MHKTTLRWAAGLALLGSALLAQAAPPKEVRLDYAYYAPTSLVLSSRAQPGPTKAPPSQSTPTQR